jgi:ribonuclease HI
MSKLIINIDGGSRGNPGPAAYGCYLQPEGKPPIELKGKLGRTTNNVAEYHGLLRALEKAIELGADEVHIRADSELLVRQMLGVYRVKNAKILPLYEAAQSLIRHLGKVTFQHVYREQNAEADRLCNEALDDPRLPIEGLGLLKPPAKSLFEGEPVTAVKPAKVARQKKVMEEDEGERLDDSFKVKLVGSFLTLTSLGSKKEYAVVVKGITWKLQLIGYAGGYSPGTRVQVLGEMIQNKKGESIVKVKSMKKLSS